MFETNDFGSNPFLVHRVNSLDDGRAAQAEVFSNNTNFVSPERHQKPSIGDVLRAVDSALETQETHHQNHYENDYDDDEMSKASMVPVSPPLVRKKTLRRTRLDLERSESANSVQSTQSNKSTTRRREELAAAATMHNEEDDGRKHTRTHRRISRFKGHHQEPINVNDTFSTDVQSPTRATTSKMRVQRKSAFSTSDLERVYSAGSSGGTIGRSSRRLIHSKSSQEQDEMEKPTRVSMRSVATSTTKSPSRENGSPSRRSTHSRKLSPRVLLRKINVRSSSSRPDPPADSTDMDSDTPTSSRSTERTGARSRSRSTNNTKRGARSRSRSKRGSSSFEGSKRSHRTTKTRSSSRAPIERADGHASNRQRLSRSSSRRKIKDEKSLSSSDQSSNTTPPPSQRQSLARSMKDSTIKSPAVYYPDSALESHFAKDSEVNVSSPVRDTHNNSADFTVDEAGFGTPRQNNAFFERQTVLAATKSATGRRRRTTKLVSNQSRSESRLASNSSPLLRSNVFDLQQQNNTPATPPSTPRQSVTRRTTTLPTVPLSNSPHALRSRARRERKDASAARKSDIMQSLRQLLVDEPGQRGMQLEIEENGTRRLVVELGSIQDVTTGLETSLQ